MPETDQTDNVYSVLAVSRDLSGRMVFEATIWKQTNFDALTGLPNRQVPHERLMQKASESGHIRRRIALILIDLDRFKEVNDSLRHDRGDMLLIKIGEHIGSCAYQSGTVARLDDNEFIVILPDIGDAKDVERITRTIIGKLAELSRLGTDEAFISASVGVTFYPDGTHNLNVLFKNAGQAMYMAKNAGRNRSSYFKPDMQVEAEQRLWLTGDLRTALPSGQFRIYYRPIVEPVTGEAYKAEALTRWLHPEHDTISPHDFVSVTEDTGLITPIDDQISRQAVRQTHQ